MAQYNSKVEVEIRKYYYSSGALWYETPCVNGKEHGTERGYYPSGTLSWETPYVNGKMHGIEKSYDREKSNIDRLTLCNKGRDVLTLCCES